MHNSFKFQLTEKTVGHIKFQPNLLKAFFGKRISQVLWGLSKNPDQPAAFLTLFLEI